MKLTLIMLLVVSLVILAGIALFLPIHTLTGRYRDLIFTRQDSVPVKPVGLVFGAGYWPDGTPSDVMKDRVEAAFELYRAGRIEKALFSGDNRIAEYNEPEKMREYALSLGMPADAIALDYAGRRTYDTCYRARHVFGLEEAVLITQRYHLPRALYTCRSLGLDTVGFAADRRPYVHIRQFWAREVPALWLAWWDLSVVHPTPVPGDPISILDE